MQRLIVLEEAIGKLFKRVPHLPRESRDWIADNLWWLVIIGLVLSSFAVLGLVLQLLGTSLYMGLTNDIVTGGAAFVATLVSLAVIGFAVALEAMAIKPLRQKRRYGWELLFVVGLVLLVEALIGALISNSLSGLLNSLITAFIGFYMLFETRDYFVVKSSRKR